MPRYGVDQGRYIVQTGNRYLPDTNGLDCCCGGCWYLFAICDCEDPADPVSVPCELLGPAPPQGEVFELDGICYQYTGLILTSPQGAIISSVDGGPFALCQQCCGTPVPYVIWKNCETGEERRAGIATLEWTHLHYAAGAACYFNTGEITAKQDLQLLTGIQEIQSCIDHPDCENVYVRAGVCLCNDPEPPFRVLVPCDVAQDLTCRFVVNGFCFFLNPGGQCIEPKQPGDVIVASPACVYEACDECCDDLPPPKGICPCPEGVDDIIFPSITFTWIPTGQQCVWPGGSPFPASPFYEPDSFGGVFEIFCDISWYIRFAGWALGCSDPDSMDIHSTCPGYQQNTFWVGVDLEVRVPGPCGVSWPSTLFGGHVWGSVGDPCGTSLPLICECQGILGGGTPCENPPYGHHEFPDEGPCPNLSWSIGGNVTVLRS